MHEVWPRARSWPPRPASLRPSICLRRSDSSPSGDSPRRSRTGSGCWATTRRRLGAIDWPAKSPLAEGRLEDAASHFADALPQFDESIELHAALAAVCLRLDRWGGAAGCLKTILARRKGFRQEDIAAVLRHLGPIETLPLLLGEADLALGRYGEVPALAEKLKAAHQEAAALQLLIAYHVRRGEQGEAARRLSEGLAKYPNDFGLLLAEVRMVQARSGDNEAIARLQQFIQRNPKHFDAQMMLAQWRLARGEHAAATALADDMAKRFPNEAGAKLLRADIRLAAGKLDEALPILEELRHSDAPPEAVALLQARAALMGHRLDEAAAALARTGDAFQRSGLYKLWKGELLSAQGNLDRAAAEFSDSFHVSSVRPAARQRLVQRWPPCRCTKTRPPWNPR